MQALNVMQSLGFKFNVHQEVQNFHGVTTHRRSLQEQILNVLMTGTLSDTFYASGKELAAEAVEVMVEARVKCPEFLARALVHARNEGYMRALPVLGLAVLSGGDNRCKKLFRQVFDKVVLIPDDLRLFTALVRSKSIPGRNGLGGMVREEVSDWLAGMSEYHALKYGSAASKGMALRDILRLVRPTPKDAASAERFGWLVKGKEVFGSDAALNPQLRALEALKRATSEEEAIALIRQGRLPFEVVVPSVSKMTLGLWEALLQQASYGNLLHSLVTFTRHGVFAKQENVSLAVSKLVSAQAIAKAKVLPTNYYAAWREYVAQPEFDSRIADALRQAINLSFVNLPTLGQGTICLAPDVSGSMTSTMVSDHSEISCADIAGVFAGALLRKAEERVIALPFQTEVITEHGLSSRDDVMVTAEKVSSLGGGGTALGAPVQYLLDRKIPVSAFIGITDNEEWAFGDRYQTRHTFLESWRQYRATVSPDARAYLVTIAPHRHVAAPSGEPGIRIIYGWSDRVLKFISQDLAGGASQVQEVERMPLEAPADPKDQTAEESDQ